jgi:hypothetical protein
MPSKFSTTLIGSPVVYLGGVSPIDYMMQCVHNSYRHHPWNWSAKITNPWQKYEAPELCLGWQREVSGGNISHAITYQIPETALQTEDTEAMRLRFVCHVLLDLISDKGLPELFESIKDNLEFYEKRQQEEAPLLPAGSGIRFKIGEKYERPVFQVAQE